METIIKANNIRLEYTGRDILDIDEVTVHAYDRIGLVGDNGAGKSSLLKVLSGRMSLPGCEVQRFGALTYIAQLDDMEPEAIEIKTADDAALLSCFGVSDISPDTSSGGQKRRMEIAAALSGAAHIILADEPTSHLDQEGRELLIGQLLAFDGALLVVSHDRDLLDALVYEIWDLEDGKITQYPGGYSEYMRLKEESRRQHMAAYERYAQERRKLEAAASKKRRQAEQIDHKQKGAKAKDANESAGRLGHQKSTGSKQKKLYQAAKSLEKHLDMQDSVPAPGHIHSVCFRQSEALELHNNFPIIGEDVNWRYGCRVIFDHAKFMLPLGAKAALTGVNGAGKTSLFQMIQERADGLRISPKARIGYFSQTGYKAAGKDATSGFAPGEAFFQTGCKVAPGRSVLPFMCAGSDYNAGEIRSILVGMGFGINDMQKDLRVLSGGEIIKLLLAKLLLGRYNILLLDEPGNYLDLKGMEALETMMKGYRGTIFFISHDRRLIRNVADTVFEISDKKIIKKE